ncbi:MAG: sugar phosphate isomerase/epimerase family protein [Planctomycetota bacterium]
MNRIAVCSWSLLPTSVEDLVAKCRACGIDGVQLWLDPVRQWQWRPDEVGGRLRVEGINIVSGMFGPKSEDYSTLETIKATGGLRPDATWPDNLKAADGDAIIASRLGAPLVTFHAGFLPHEAGDPERGKLIDRLRQVAENFALRNVRTALETGQESAGTLAALLGELNSALPARAHVGVNFDPANMILYGMGDPIAALRELVPHVLQVHIKDAVPAARPGSWGEERKVGTGAVDWPAFFRVLREARYAGDYVIERESGDDRVGDVAAARELIERQR